MDLQANVLVQVLAFGQKGYYLEAFAERISEATAFPHPSNGHCTKAPKRKQEAIVSMPVLVC